MSDTFGDILSDIEKADLKTREGRAALEARVRSKYPIRDILLIHSFIRGGIFISTAETSAVSLLRKVANGEKVDIRWTRTSAGIVTGTPEEDRELTRLWEALVRSCYVTIGAASVLKSSPPTPTPMRPKPPVSIVTDSPQHLPLPGCGGRDHPRPHGGTCSGSGSKL